MLDIKKCKKGEDEILGTLAASITPRKEVDDMLIATALRKQPKHSLSMPPPTVEEGEICFVVTFDGSTRTKRKGRAYRAIVGKLPEWKIADVAANYAAYLTANEAEFRSRSGVGRIVICDVSNLVIRQMRG